MDRGVSVEAMGVEELRERVLQLEENQEALLAVEERRRVSASLEALRFPDERGKLVLAPMGREKLAAALASVEPDQRGIVLSALSEVTLMPKPGASLPGDDSGMLLTRADMAVIQDEARRKKRPVEDVQREFMAARERQIAAGRYRAR